MAIEVSVELRPLLLAYLTVDTIVSVYKEVLLK